MRLAIGATPFCTIAAHHRRPVVIAAAEKKSIREKILGMGNDIDSVDRMQQIDIDRLFGALQELQNQ